jgi:hypothetical protein
MLVIISNSKKTYGWNGFVAFSEKYAIWAVSLNSDYIGKIIE